MWPGSWRPLTGQPGAGQNCDWSRRRESLPKENGVPITKRREKNAGQAKIAAIPPHYPMAAAMYQELC